ncbi:hypothetical protein E2C01_072246 [Portunus trituberculatus]|uniref:Uncharacterized protein n=1 Tax=Portunus trituberculatus TaxID=210409 RepID=A0A5B7HZD7_PORTR|nr:hypothetical protein [Portunus trituberculatus]
MHLWPGRVKGKFGHLCVARVSAPHQALSISRSFTLSHAQSPVYRIPTITIPSSPQIYTDPALNNTPQPTPTPNHSYPSRPPPQSRTLTQGIQAAPPTHPDPPRLAPPSLSLSVG